MNWDQIERKWSAMTQRVRMDFCAPIEKQAESQTSRQGSTSAGRIMLSDIKTENVMPKRTLQL